MPTLPAKEAREALQKWGEEVERTLTGKVGDRYLQLADPLAPSTHPAEQKGLKEQLAPLAFGD
jgi:hypothetical protein